VVGAVLLSGDGDGGGGRADRQQEPQAQARERDRDRAEQERPADAAPEPVEPGPADPPAAPDPSATIDPARGVELNEQGFALMSRGDFAAAVPILEQAVASWPADARELDYAYALFNLGKSLNRAGRPAEAIPHLEKRLEWDDQRATVEAELDLARRRAARG
jgi:tetratricopeptide (TPR) repeat protein